MGSSSEWWLAGNGMLPSGRDARRFRARNCAFADQSTSARATSDAVS